MTQNRDLETSRLHLRPLALTDAPELFPLFHDPQTMQFWPTLPHKFIQDTTATIEGMLRPQKACWWVVCLRGEETAVGFLGFLGNEGAPGMGYILQRDLWGHGYTTEGMRAVIDYGFHSRHYDRTELWIHEENIASQRVAHKLGFSNKGRLRSKFPGRETAHDMLVYGLRVDEWIDTAVPPSRGQHFYRLEPVLPVQNVLSAAHYYRDKLGFVVDSLDGEPPNLAIVSRGMWTTQTVRIQLRQVAAGTAVQHAGELYIITGADIDGLFQTYQANGVTIISEPVTQSWGRREFAIVDNNGHQLRFGVQV
ncbi:MAG: GNAT family N-acetyltransferase [Chloroflexi bacterium]|nr:GNAT family N-acetyltransferase [Chloroflexota bacterium]